MKYDIAAKPTRYNGINFRSRLEARWAAFFDLVGWDYVYEPSEIAGHNPDFIIRCKSKDYNTNICIVEIKPSVFLTENEIKKLCKKYIQLEAHLLILSDMPFQETSAGVQIGVGLQLWGQEHFETSFEMKCRDDFGSYQMGYDGMIYGLISRKHFDYHASEYQELWKQAGNITQFKING